MPKQNLNWPNQLPEMTTGRLVLRQLQESDVDLLFELRSDETVNRYVKRRRQINTAETLKFIKKINKGIRKQDWAYWAICKKGSTGLIGTICIWNFSAKRDVAEVGYELHPAFRGSGYMDEALKSIIRYGFEILGLERLEAFTHRENLPSAKLLEKNRFMLQPDRKDTDNPDNIIYSLENHL